MHENINLIAARMTKNVGAFRMFSLSCMLALQGTRKTTHGYLRGGGGGRVKMRKCLITEQVYPRQQQQLEGLDGVN